MKIEKTTFYTRRVLVTGLPQEHPLDPAQQEIMINYTGQPTGANAIPLDHIIIPEIIRRFNAHEDLLAALVSIVGWTRATTDPWNLEIACDLAMSAIAKANKSEDNDG